MLCLFNSYTARTRSNHTLLQVHNNTYNVHAKTHQSRACGGEADTFALCNWWEADSTSECSIGYKPEVLIAPACADMSRRQAAAGCPISLQSCCTLLSLEALTVCRCSPG